MAGRMCQDTASSGGITRGETLRVMGLGWSIFGDADTAAEERGLAEPRLSLCEIPSERGTLLWLREPMGCIANK